MSTSDLLILKREALTKKLEIVNKLEYLEDALKNPQKYSHIKLSEDQLLLIEEWFVSRATDLLGNKESAEKEYSWFVMEN
jgi:hypothetical protein